MKSEKWHRKKNDNCPRVGAGTYGRTQFYRNLLKQKINLKILILELWTVMFFTRQ